MTDSNVACTFQPQVIPEGEEGPTVETRGRGAQSPLSPGQKQRVEEKQELQNLNSRLAAYIDRVRTLQEENGRLMVQVRSKEETVTREVVAVKETYEKELTDVKALLDDATKEKAALQVEKRNLRASNEDLKEK